jgi:protein-disulfide isomerase
MQCDEARFHSADYLNEGRPRSVQSEVYAHLRTCAACRREFEELQALWSDLGSTHAPSNERLETRAALIAELKWRSNMRVVFKAIVVLLIGAGLAAGAGLLLRSNTPAPPSAVATAAAGHSRGAEGASVVLVEYGDYECPPCFARQYHVIIDRLLEKYPQTVRYEFRHFPLEKIHPNSLTAAMAAEAAGAQGKFWEMHKLLLSSHQRWYRSPKARDVFVELAGRLGLDMNTFTSGLDSKSIETKVRQDQAAGLAQGIQGTPTFLINGKKLDPAPETFDAFDRLVTDQGRGL